MAATEAGHTEIVELLKEAGADGNLEYELRHAAEEGDLAEVKRLLELGTDVNLQDTEYGATALMWAAGYGHTEIVELLIVSGADLDLKSQFGYTALMMAANGGYTNIVELLINAGAEVNVQNVYGDTALMLAAGWCHTEIVELLKAAGAVE